MTPRRLFALDQNFPEPIIATLMEAIDCAELVSVRDIGKELPTLDDWELLLRLHADPREWDGLITCDASMLSLSREMAVLERTGLSLVIADGQGHNPIRATGLLLTHIEHICHQTVRNRSQIWTLRAGQKNPDKATRYLEKIADREKVSIETCVWMAIHSMTSNVSRGLGAEDESGGRCNNQCRGSVPQRPQPQLAAVHHARHIDVSLASASRPSRSPQLPPSG